MSTAEYMLRVEGKKYAVTRTYKKNLHFLAEWWIRTDGFVLTWIGNISRVNQQRSKPLRSGG